MTERAFNRFGTIAFETSFMKDTIGVGLPIFSGSEFRGFDRAAAPNTLSIAPWLAFVPEVYRDEVTALAQREAREMIHLGTKATDMTLDVFIARLKAAIESEIRPR